MAQEVQYIYEVIQLIWSGSVIRIQISLTPTLMIISSYQSYCSETGLEAKRPWIQFGVLPLCRARQSMLKGGDFKINRRTCHFTTTFKESIALRQSIVQKNHFE